MPTELLNSKLLRACLLLHDARRREPLTVRPDACARKSTRHLLMGKAMLLLSERTALASKTVPLLALGPAELATSRGECLLMRHARWAAACSASLLMGHSEALRTWICLAAGESMDLRPCEPAHLLMCYSRLWRCKSA